MSIHNNCKSEIVSPATDATACSESVRKQKYALVMKGGGMKGLAFIGAFGILAEAFEFDLYVGTSAGALVAAFLGAGFKSDELEHILLNTDFMEFIPERFSCITNLIFYGGLFRGTEFKDWINRVLAKKLSSPRQVKFAQLPFDVRIYACRRDVDALIFDSKKDSEKYVAYAVRCSASIPLFFTPERDQGLSVFDGGIRHNYPVDKLLEETGRKAFIGMYLGDSTYLPRKNRILSDVLSIVTEARDDEALTKYADQTIIIDPKPITTFDFCLSLNEKMFLLLQGKAAALVFLCKQGHALSHVADYVNNCASIAKEQVLSERSYRKRMRTRRFGSIATISAGILIGLIYFGSWLAPWSLNNCPVLASEAQRFFDLDHANTQGTTDLISCRNPLGYSILGDAAFFRRAYSVAEENFKKAIAHLREGESTLRLAGWRDDLAAAQIENGEYGAAKDILKDLVDHHPDEDEYKWDLAKAYIYLGQADFTAYGLALDTLSLMKDQNYSGRTAAGRVSMLKAAAHAGQSLSDHFLQSERNSAAKRAAAEFCEGRSQNEAFWRPVFKGTKLYPNSSFKVEIDLLRRAINAADIQCPSATSSDYLVK